MRKILFRGKRVDNGEWLYGDLLHDKFLLSNEKICQIYDMNSNLTHRQNIVLPETIGQYTGLSDKNRTKIFEGDIVNILGNQDVANWKDVNYNALIAFIDGGFCAINGTLEEHGFRRYALARMDFDLEVIGNIYDNPELLGGAE